MRKGRELDLTRLTYQTKDLSHVIDINLKKKIKTTYKV